MDLVGKILADRYEIREEVGKGGMAQVYKAWCNLLNRYVAIKVLKEEYKDDKEFVHRFNVEAQAAAGISNPHVVSIYDVGFEHGLYYIVMEYIEGITLKEYIAEKGSLPWREAASYAAQICEGLVAAHKASVVHRDIKPQNIIMTPEGILKVTDFGIARSSGQATTTMSGSAIGTVHYLSPEQARGVYTDHRTDIYSLGVVLYEMLTGKLPFVDESPVAVAIKHIQESPMPLRLINEEIPTAMEAITLRAMAKEQNLRYPHAEDFLADLEHVLRDTEYKIPRKENPAIDDDEMGSTTKMEGIDERKIRDYERKKRSGEKARTSQRSRTDREEKEKDGSEESKLREIDTRRQQREQKKKERRITWAAILAAILVVGILGFAMVAMTGGVSFLQGGEKVEIPRLIDMDLEKAQHEYKDSFSIIRQKEEQSDKAAGTILEQKPEAGSKVKKKDDMIIYVVVSAGSDAATLDSYVGWESAQAQDALKEAGYQTNIVEKPSDSMEKGKVFAQEPAAGSTVSRGGLVTLYISKGEGDPEPTASTEPSETDAPTETPKPTATTTVKPTETNKPTEKPIQTNTPTQKPSEGNQGGNLTSGGSPEIGE